MYSIDINIFVQSIHIDYANEHSPPVEIGRSAAADKGSTKECRGKIWRAGKGSPAGLERKRREVLFYRNEYADYQVH